jgi:putative ABC transport system permease protein
MFDVVGKLPGVVDQTILLTGGLLELDPRPDAKGIAYESDFVKTNYFSFFGLHFLEGSVDTAFAAPNQIVVTERVAREHFGAPPWIGKVAAVDPKRMDGVSRLTIGGVIANPPVESHREASIFSDIRPFEKRVFGAIGAGWDFDVSGGHYVRLSPNVNVPAFQALMKAEVEKAATGGSRAACRSCRLRLDSLPLPAIHLAGRRDSAIDSTGETTMLITLGSGAAALLIVSAFNFITLSLARSLRRRKEVALRKVVGANQGVIMRHYLAESLLITTISLAIGFGLAELLHSWFARQLAQPDDLFSLYDPIFLGTAIAAGLALAVVVGVYPALYLAHVRPRVGLDNGEASNSGIVARLVSGGLLGLQIGAATVLLAVALTMGAQSQYVAARPLGYSMANMIAITPYCQMPGATPGAGTETGCDRVFLGPARATRGVVQATRAATNDLFSDQATPSSLTLPGRSDVLGKAHFIANETDFLEMMNVTILAGRLFDTASAFDRQLLDKRQPLNTAEADRIPIVVTRAFLPLIGAREPQDAVGQLVASSEVASKVRAFEIVGVIEDWHRRTLRFAVEPIVFTPGGAQMQVVAKLTPDVEGTIKTTLQAQAGKPGMPLFMGVRALDDSFETSYSADQRVMLAVANFAALAVIVAGLGVFALSAFDIQRRVREIGIRKALGAAPVSVASMVMGRSLRSALIASVLSWPVAWWLSNTWLNGFVYRTDLGQVLLPVATAVVLAFVLLAVSVNTARAAAIRPDSALRTAV